MKYLILIFCVLLTSASFSQIRSATNYYAQIKGADLSELWLGDSVYSEEEGEGWFLKFPEPIGFIGDN